MYGLDEVSKMIDIDFKQYSMEELSDLNSRLVEHLRVRQQRESQREMEQFEIGDLVSFEGNHGEIVEGKIIRFNQKSVTVQVTGSRSTWRVPPQVLSKVVETTAGNTTDALEALFTRINDRGTFSPVSTDMKVSRNAPCPCGSGKKYKRCCAKH